MARTKVTRVRVWELTRKRSPHKIRAVELNSLTFGTCQFKKLVRCYFRWQLGHSFTSGHSWGWVNGLHPGALPAVGAAGGPNVHARVGAGTQRSSAASRMAFTPSTIVPLRAVVGMSAPCLLIHHRMSNLETCVVLHSVQRCNRKENLYCFHGNLCVGPWLEQGSRMLSVPAVGDFNTSSSKESMCFRAPPKPLLVIDIRGLWWMYY